MSERKQSIREKYSLKNAMFGKEREKEQRPVDMEAVQRGGIAFWFVMICFCLAMRLFF